MEQVEEEDTRDLDTAVRVCSLCPRLCCSGCCDRHNCLRWGPRSSHTAVRHVISRPVCVWTSCVSMKAERLWIEPATWQSRVHCRNHYSLNVVILISTVLWYIFVYEGDINKAGDRVLVARGGDGGMQSNHFVGQKGDALSVTLDLKVISDIGFVGYVIYQNLFDQSTWSE